MGSARALVLVRELEVLVQLPVLLLLELLLLLLLVLQQLLLLLLLEQENRLRADLAPV